MHPEPLQEGRYYGPEDGNRAVVVIGSLAKDRLFGEGRAVGEPVTINGHTFTVIGVTQDQEGKDSLISIGGFENMAYYPYALAKKLVPVPMLHRIMVQIRPDVEPKSLVKGVEAAMAQRLDPQQFSVLTSEDLLRLVFKITSILTWLLTGLTSIALFVAGVGIMTVMLMSVGERAKEIGIRKATGATRSDIFVQFLTEAVVITLVGGAAGFALSWGVCLWLAAHTPIKPEVTWGVAALSFGTSTVVGIVFGILPAVRAAMQDPIAALRAE
jgi:putative ABC transport system permease protein